jgi:PAS domain S-box-containing protein
MEKNLDILIINDSADDYDYYIHLLQDIQGESSYRCTLARDGAKGLKLLDAEKFNCVLVDYALPDMDGLGVLKNIATRYPFLPVILLARQGNEATAVEAIKCGANDYLIKSMVSRERLCEAIGSAINSSNDNRNNREPKQLSILIIDDNPDDRERYIRLLKENSNTAYRFVDAGHSKAGLEYINTEPFDCVLLDYSLPGMNGLDVLKHIRARHPFLPVILLTGQGSETIAVEAIKCGANNYLAKSAANIDELHHMVMLAVDQCAMQRNIVKKDREIKEKTVALAQSEERYNLAVRGMSVGLWDWNVTTNEVFWTEKFNDMLGISDPDFKSSFDYFTSHLHPEDKENTLKMLFGHLTDHMPYSVEYRIQRTDGMYVWIHACGQAMWDAGGKPTRMVGSVNNISGRKEVETQREKLIEKLADSNTELGRFAYVASHDMQEPLRMIANFSALIAEEYGDKLDEEGKEYIHLMTDAALRMQSMVEDLLEYARIGNDSAHFSMIDGTHELKQVLDNLSVAIKERHAHITYNPLPPITGNPVQFMRLIQNLICNGLKYQPEGAMPQIHVGVEDQGDDWCFFVRDNGIGMPQEYAGQIFEPFRRLHTWKEYKGTGIGLAICKKIVENHGGKIWAVSEIGRGSTFYFALPKIQEKEEV